MTDQPRQDYFEQVEQGLREAMRRGAHVRHGGTWRRLERRVRSRRARSHQAGSRGDATTFSAKARTRRRMSVVLVAAACVAVAAIVVFAVDLDAGTQQAFAGWSPTPTTPAKGQRAAAETRCRSALRAASRSDLRAVKGPSGGTRGERAEWRKLLRSRRRTGIRLSRAARWKAVAADTRGPYTLSLLIHGDKLESCIIGPRTSGYAPVSLGFSLYSRKPVPAGEINDAGGITEGGSGKNAHTFVEGRTGAGVEGVTLLLADGRRVVATTEKGWYLVWWPGKSRPLTAEVRTASGTRRQPLEV